MNSKRTRWSALALGGAALLLSWPGPGGPAPDENAPRSRRSGPTRTADGPRSSEAEGAWWSDRLMVHLAPGAEDQALAEDLGLTILHPAGPAGLVTVRVPPGSSPDALAARLQGDPRVLGTARSGRTHGASSEATLGDLRGLQWHLERADVPEPSRLLEDVSVAVLDTGVAYDSPTGGCTAVPSLKTLYTRAPWDFVNNDAVPCDDHQHGTHITSLIASRGAVMGVAPHVAVIPVKVLDASDSGDEQALIDGIRWAVTKGADVINLSLSFSEGYQPSGALLSALRDAADAGVVMVAAAGNDPDAPVTWPAASPLVLAVGASAPVDADGMGLASYSATGPQLDLLAPGGSLDTDIDDDGHMDGVLAETIMPGDPGTAAYYYYEGTSQAAAQVSAAAAWLLASGASPEEVTVLLQSSASSVGDRPFLDGSGAGTLDLSAALEALEAGSAPSSDLLFASVLPTLRRDATGALVPTARIRVVNDEGDPIDGVEVIGRVHTLDAPEAQWVCPETVDGACEVRLDGVADDGDTVGAWSFTVDGVIEDGVMRSPTPMMYGSDGLELLAAALGDRERPATSIAFLWDEGDTDGEHTLAAGATLLDLGGDGARAPSALVLSRGLVESLFEAHALALTGSGLSTDALGVTASGLSTDALGVFASSGLSTDALGVFTASGLSTDALGIVSMSSTSGSGLSTDALGASGDVMAVRGSGQASALLGLSARALTEPGHGVDLGLGLTDTFAPAGGAAGAEALGDTRTSDAFTVVSGASSLPLVPRFTAAMAGEVSEDDGEPSLPEGDATELFESD